MILLYLKGKEKGRKGEKWKKRLVMLFNERIDNDVTSIWVFICVCLISVRVLVINLFMVYFIWLLIFMIFLTLLGF